MSARSSNTKLRPGGVTLKEMHRRLGRSFEAIHRAAAKELGEDIGDYEQTQAIAWAFAYLLGGYLAHLVNLSQDPVAVEQWIGKAMATRIREYADANEARAAEYGVEHQIRALRDIAARLTAVRPDGRPRLVLIRSLTPAAE